MKTNDISFIRPTVTFRGEILILVKEGSWHVKLPY